MLFDLNYIKLSAKRRHTLLSKSQIGQLLVIEIVKSKNSVTKFVTLLYAGKGIPWDRRLFVSRKTDRENDRQTDELTDRTKTGVGRGRGACRRAKNQTGKHGVC